MSVTLHFCSICLMLAKVRTQLTSTLHWLDILIGIFGLLFHGLTSTLHWLDILIGLLGLLF
jgi:hypothetical protein